jgi:hypothetical protein
MSSSTIARESGAASGATTITARLHESGFGLSDSNFFSLSRASDGNVYYTLSSHNIDTHARVYRYNPARDEVRLLASLGRMVGEEGTRTIPQGKSHSPFFEAGGKLYLATHYGFMNPDSSKEEPGVLPAGYQPYPGGHFVEFDLATETFRDLAKAPPGEGIITMGMDTRRGRLYGLTWPSGLFLSYDLATRQLHNFGPVCRGGEAGTGDTYMCLCRCFAIEPETGSIYFTLPDGEIIQYDYHRDQLRALTDIKLQLDIFGQWDHQRPGHQGYNWRQIFWYEPWNKFVAVHPRTAWLYTFDPFDQKIELLERICAAELKRNGRFEPFRYGYLTLELGLDGRTIYYLTGTHRPPIEGSREVNERPHLITFDLPTGRYRDHGVLRLVDGRYPRMAQTLLAHTDGRLYSCPWIEKPDRQPGDKVLEQVDLISFEDPLNTANATV